MYKSKKICRIQLVIIILTSLVIACMPQITKAEEHVHVFQANIITPGTSSTPGCVEYTCSCGSNYNLYYYISNNEVAITAVGSWSGSVTEFIVPDTIEGKKVTSISSAAIGWANTTYISAGIKKSTFQWLYLVISQALKL